MKREENIFDFGAVKGERSSTGDDPKLSPQFSAGRSNPEVSINRHRRSFTRNYKLTILKELNTSKHSGQKGAILRREGLYSSHITTWKRQLEAGKLEKKKEDQNQKRIAALYKENQRLQKELNRAKLIIEVQKKISKLIEENQ